MHYMHLSTRRTRTGRRARAGRFSELCKPRMLGPDRLIRLVRRSSNDFVHRGAVTMLWIDFV